MNVQYLSNTYTCSDVVEVGIQSIYFSFHLAVVRVVVWYAIFFPSGMFL